VNQLTGIAGDWTGTPLEHIYESCNQNVEEAGLMFGRLFKKIVIDRKEEWVGTGATRRIPHFHAVASTSRAKHTSFDRSQHLRNRKTVRLLRSAALKMFELIVASPV
jgi:hypothetical protein